MSLCLLFKWPILFWGKALQGLAEKWALAMLRSWPHPVVGSDGQKNPFYLKRSLFFVCSVNFPTRLRFLPCKRPDSFSKNTATRWGLLQGCAWVWNACACTPWRAALRCSDCLIVCLVSTDFANQCTCTTCWRKPYREEVSGGHFSLSFLTTLFSHFKSSLSARKPPTK